MKAGDTVMLTAAGAPHHWTRVGLVLGWSRGMVLVFWGEDFPCEPEYLEQLKVVR